MPLPVMDLSRLKTNSLVPPDLMQNLQQGMQTYYMPQQLKAQQQQMNLQNQLAQNQVNYAPQMSEQELQMARLKNALGQNELNYAPQMSQATLAQMAAQTGLAGSSANLNNQYAKLPFGGASLPGTAGQLLGLESIKQMYGEDSEQYKAAKQMFQLEQQNMQSRINYQNALTQTMPIRYTTPLGKEMIEQANVAQGNAPTGLGWEQQINPPGGNPFMGGGGNQMPSGMQGQMSPMPQNMQAPPQQPQATPQQIQGAQGQMPGVDIGMNDKFLLPNKPIAPGSPEELANQYALKRIKDISDPGTRERTLYAHNMEVTMKNFNVDDLVKFSGLKGGIELKKQEGLDAQRKPTSEEFKRYTAAQKSAELLAHQARQFYKDSIQPIMMERLEKMTNPTGWFTSPETAKRNYLQIKSILGQEMKTYNDAIKYPGVYTGENEKSSHEQKVRRYNPATGTIE